MITHDTMTHDEAIELLPWLVNESLEPDEREVVHAHATSCVICRRELDELRALHQAIDSTAAVIEAPEPDMRRINARIDEQLERESQPSGMTPLLQSLFGSPWRVAFAAQSVALLAVTVLWLMPANTPPEYQTLTSTAALPEGHYVRVVFDPTLDEATVNALLETTGMTVAAGPSERGVVTLRFDEATNNERRDAIVAQMRDDVRVLFAEPVVSEE